MESAPLFHLTGVDHPTGTDPTFSYNIDGLRTSVTDGYGEFTQWYVFDGSSLLAEVNASDGALRRVYTSGATGQVSEHTLTGGALDNNYHQDARGDILYYTDSSQNMLQRYAYDGWGKGVGNGGGSQSPRAALVGAQGYYRHVGGSSAVDLYALGIRFYNPFLGRFLQRDPSCMVDGPNLYIYVNNNPANATDPTGRFLKDAPYPPGYLDPDNPAECPKEQPVGMEWAQWCETMYHCNLGICWDNFKACNEGVGWAQKTARWILKKITLGGSDSLVKISCAAQLHQCLLEARAIQIECGLYIAEAREKRGNFKKDDLRL